jgi:hypothetical protein
MKAKSLTVPPINSAYIALLSSETISLAENPEVCPGVAASQTEETVKVWVAAWAVLFVLMQTRLRGTVML